MTKHTGEEDPSRRRVGGSGRDRRRGLTMHKIMGEHGLVVCALRRKRRYRSHVGEVSEAPENTCLDEGEAPLCSRQAKRAVGHRHHGVPHPRRQVLPLAGDRLLRRNAHRPVHRHVPERAACRLLAPAGMRPALGLGASPRVLRSRRPLPVARLNRHLRRARHRTIDVEEGVLARDNSRGRASSAG